MLQCKPFNIYEQVFTLCSGELGTKKKDFIRGKGQPSTFKFVCRKYTAEIAPDWWGYHAEIMGVNSSLPYTITEMLLTHEPRHVISINVAL